MSYLLSADDMYIEDVQATAQHVADGIIKDIEYQTNKFGAQRLYAAGWFLVIVEEAGEVAQAYMKKDYDEAIAEAKQTIACYSRLITELQREKVGLADAESHLYTKPY